MLFIPYKFSTYLNSFLFLWAPKSIMEQKYYFFFFCLSCRSWPPCCSSQVAWVGERKEVLKWLGLILPVCTEEHCRQGTAEMDFVQEPASDYQALPSIFFFFLAVPHGLWDLSSPDQGSNTGPLPWKCGVLTTGPPGNSKLFLLRTIFLQLTVIHSQHSVSLFE